MRLLHLDEALDRAKIIAEVQIARRLNAGKHPLGKLRHCRPVRPGLQGGPYGNAIRGAQAVAGEPTTRRIQRTYYLKSASMHSQQSGEKSAGNATPVLKL
jgi:hypothetical protein